MTHTPVQIVIASVPFVITTEPIMAPAVLKSTLIQQGYTCAAIDLNRDIVRMVINHDDRQQIEDFFTHKRGFPEQAAICHEMIRYCADQIMCYQPEIVGLSLLTFECQIFTRWLCAYLKTHYPHVIIVIGGSGIKDFLATENNSFCDTMMADQLIDHYIMGDGNQALLELLKNNLDYPGIDKATWSQDLDLDRWPFPDYDDYGLELFDDVVIPMSDSRGCVRTCDFCDIIEHWRRYVYRSADSLFQEMLHQQSRYKIQKFSMRNSLTNGNMKQFRQWVTLLAEHNLRQPDSAMSWTGYFIVRESNQHPEDIWQLISASGGTLILGVESLIKRVRWNMGKKFSDEAIDYHLEMAQKHRVPVVILLIVGSPEETRQDYEFTKQWFRDRLHFAQNPVERVVLSPASILPGTEWHRESENNNLVVNIFPSNWVHRDQNITPADRLQYFDELTEICTPFCRDLQRLRRAPAAALHVMAL